MKTGLGLRPVSSIMENQMDKNMGKCRGNWFTSGLLGLTVFAVAIELLQGHGLSESHGADFDSVLGRMQQCSTYLDLAHTHHDHRNSRGLKSDGLYTQG